MGGEREQGAVADARASSWMGEQRELDGQMQCRATEKLSEASTVGG